MCGSEPCRCERADAITSLVASATATAKAEGERDEALATLAKVALLVRPLGILYAALPGLYAIRCKHILDDLRAALDSTP